MKVTEQIDAIEASAVNPYKLLVVTRVLACIVALPLLTLVADFCGVFAGWVAETLVEPDFPARLRDQGFASVTFSDFLAPTFRTVRLRSDHRPGGLLSGHAHARRHRGRRAFGDELGRAVVAVRDPGRRHPRQADSHFFPMTPAIAETRLDSPQSADTPGEPVLVLRDVHKSFGAQHVLDGISLTVVRGETLTVLGRSGTGKSVLLRLIIGLENPDAGSIWHSRAGDCGSRPRRDESTEDQDGLPVSACGALRLADRGAERGVPPGAAYHRCRRPNGAIASRKC